MTGSTKLNTILQCFVDLNLETNENSTFSIDLLDVSFDKNKHVINEGEIVELKVSLSSPSTSGYEEVEVDVVANNSSLVDFDNLGETYPRTLLFSAGQQSQTIKFLANNDFIEESIESFDVILGFFTNTKPGQYITSTVNIIDKTNLKEVFINQFGGSIQTSNITNNPILTFSTLEGTSKQIKVSLDSPSVFGIETASIQFTNKTTKSNDYSIVGSTNLSWVIGEQDKFLTIQANDDEKIENTEVLEIEISSTNFTNIISPNKAEFIIFDNSPDERFINVNFQGIYTQIGGFNYQNITNLRNIIDNEKINNGSGDEIMLLKFGEKFRSSVKTTNINSPVYSCGDNCIRTEIAGIYNDVLFFGKNPSTGEYGDVRLKIINRGLYPVIIDGNQLNQGDFTIFDVDSFDYNITLPANDVLIPAGTIIGNTTLSADTVTEAIYEFIIESDYTERKFVLEDLSNVSAVNGSIKLGIHRFEETYSLTEATGTTNQHNLVTTYNQVLANYNNYPTINDTKKCIPLAAYSNNYTFPSNPTEAISQSNGIGYTRINGFAMLSDNNKHYGPSGVGSGPSGYDESSYIKIEFLPSGQTINTTCPSITVVGNQTNTGWSSIPFEIIL